MLNANLRYLSMKSHILTIILAIISVFFTDTLFAFNQNKIMSVPNNVNQTKIQIKDIPYQLDGKGKGVQAYELIFITPDGSASKEGYFGVKGEMFNVMVENMSSKATTLHWHGLILPNSEDGVPNVTQVLIQPGEKKSYNYKLLQAGTFWMHSHQGLQEQQQLSAPFIIYESAEKRKDHEVTMFLEDFTYENPRKIFNKLRSSKMKTSKVNAKESQDFNDINYDAFLTNKKSLANPEIVMVSPGEKIRIRIINASSSTNYQINLGELDGTLTAVDGEKIKHLSGKKFPIGIANRLDVTVQIPEKGGAFPILALVEGESYQTGLILATEKSAIPKINPIANKSIGRVDYYGLETRLHSKQPLKKRVADKTFEYVLEGKMAGYVWTINKQSWPKITPSVINYGDRIEMIFINKNSMSHPMHLHGHVFQVTEIDGQAIKDGAKRDTVLVQPNTTVKVQFNADNPGVWVMHCHNLYHLAAGMLTTLQYQGYSLPKFYLNVLEQP